MTVACIACGGIIEGTLIVMGLSFIIRWLKKRHNKSKCKCCQSKKSPDNKEELHRKEL